jgi:hypothetical protein
MADLSDILSGKSEDEGETLYIDSMCEICFYWMDSSTYYPKSKKLHLKCPNGHETVIDWEIWDG